MTQRFNPHARVGRDLCRGFRNGNHLCFNPHARVGRDRTKYITQTEYKVSIHTPVWGVTEVAGKPSHHCRVSIHTPVWGVTSTILVTSSFADSFNPHARVGRDWLPFGVASLPMRFNPHARVGRDRLCFYDMCFSALIGVKCESLGLHLQKYSFFIEFASNILIIKWCERIGISAMLMVLVYIIRSALKLKELSIPMCSTFPSQ